MDPNGNIIEEKKWVPAASVVTPTIKTATSQTTPPAFSNADAYSLQSQWYANQWNNVLANAYWDLAKNLWKYSSFANNSLWAYDSLLNYVRGNEQNLQWASNQLYNQLVWDLQNSRNYLYNTFWPEWTLTKEVNQYYDDLWNYLATDAGRQAAQIAAQWVHSWASLWAIRAQQNEAYNESFQRYIQAKEQQINAKQQIAKQLLDYMGTLRQEYGNTTNQYIIDLYKRANDLYNNIASSATADIDSYNQALATAQWTSSSKWQSMTLEDYATWVNYLVSAWKITKEQWNEMIANAYNQYYNIISEE